MPTIPDIQSGWSVSFREDFYNDQVPWLQMAQGLYKTEAVALATLLFMRDQRGHVEVLDRTGTTRGYFSPTRPGGFFET